MAIPDEWAWACCPNDKCGKPIIIVVSHGDDVTRMMCACGTSFEVKRHEKD